MYTFVQAFWGTLVPILNKGRITFNEQSTGASMKLRNTWPNQLNSRWGCREYAQKLQQHESSSKLFGWKINFKQKAKLVHLVSYWQLKKKDISLQ